MRGTQLDPPPRDMHVQAGSPSGLAWLQGVINEKRMHVAVGKRIEQRTRAYPCNPHPSTRSTASRSSRYSLYNTDAGLIYPSSGRARTAPSISDQKCRIL